MANTDKERKLEVILNIIGIIIICGMVIFHIMNYGLFTTNYEDNMFDCIEEPNWDFLDEYE